MSNIEPPKPQNGWYWRHPVVVLFGTIVVGALGSGLWDIGVKPSLTWVLRSLLDIVTLGSSTIKDSAYAAAALDQTAAPSAYVYQMLISFLWSPLALFLAWEFGFTPERVRRLILRNSAARSPDDNSTDRRIACLELQTEQSEARRKSLRHLRRILLVVLGLLIGYVTARALVHNQSLLIWRSFQADMKMCAPYLTDSEEEKLQSDYSAMKSKADFLRVLKPLQNLAQQHELRLHSENLW